VYGIVRSLCLSQTNVQTDRQTAEFDRYMALSSTGVQRHEIEIYTLCSTKVSRLTMKLFTDKHTTYIRGRPSCGSSFGIGAEIEKQAANSVSAWLLWEALQQVSVSVVSREWFQC